MGAPKHFFLSALFALLFSSGFAFSDPSDMEKDLYSSPANQEPVASCVKQVVDILGTVRWVEATFTEQKELGAMTQPLRSSGRIVFSPDHGLYRQTTHPLPTELILRRNELIQRDANGEVSRMNVGRLPPAKAFIDLFLAVLSGDDRRWGKHFDVFFQGTPDHWRIGFLAKPNSPVARGLRRISISGEGPRFQVIKMVEKNGDQTTTRYSDHRVLLRGEEEMSALAPFPRLSPHQ